MKQYGDVCPSFMNICQNAVPPSYYLSERRCGAFRLHYTTGYRTLTSLLLNVIRVSEFSAKAFENTPNTFPYNATGHPALSINAGFSESEPRLPVGMMMVGRHFDDVTVLRLAHAYERLRDSSTEYSTVSAQLESKFNKGLEVA